ncbi:MAG: hypothetical protein JO300_08410 [Silvibacterium sp.]|nr:hypothetical protein [Silvibacterium sp.]
MNFAISGCGRLVREVRAALSRREREHEVALSAAFISLGSELRESVAGLLLQVQLALAEPRVDPELSGRLRLILDLAVTLRQKLDRQGPQMAGPDKPVIPVPAQMVRTQGKPQAAVLSV